MYKKVANYCESVGITITQFERICGTSKDYMSKLKNHSPSVKIAKRIAQVMGITVDELLSDEDD